MIPIPYGRQDINESDIEAVIEVLRSDFLTQGPFVPMFERAVTEYCEVNYAVAVNSATSALHLACLALNIGKDDIVWTSAISFVASANCALYCGAKIDFIDIDPLTYNLSIDNLEKKLEIAKALNSLPKLIIPVHLCGQSSDMKAIYNLSLKYGFKIIEDASHAIGGKYNNKNIGNCEYSDIAVFSFHPVKIITTGEGGMAVTKNIELHKKMVLLRSHGITRDPEHMSCIPHGSWHYQQIDLGYNYRMTDIQAALGLNQLKRIDEFVSKRNELAFNYNKSFEDTPLITPYQAKNIYSAFHLYVIRLPINNKKNNRNKFFELLRGEGIQVNIHYIPIYQHPYYEKMNFDKNKYQQAELYYKEAVSLPLYSSLSEDLQKRIIETVKALICS